MIKITVNKKHYKGIYRWDEMSLSRYCDLSAIEIPEGYEAFILADGKFDAEHIEQYVEEVSKLTDKQVKEDFPAYYRKVISCLSDIPLHVKLPDDLVTELYELYFKPFVLSMIYNAPVISFMGKIEDYQPERIARFRIGMNYYYLPEVVRIMDQDVPLQKESILVYSEASDIFKGLKISQNVRKLALFMAIYCRKKNEEYDEATILHRKDLFMNVPMSTVWAVFFCTARQLSSFTIISRLFTGLQRTVAESVQEVRTYRNTVAADSSLKQPVMVD